MGRCDGGVGRETRGKLEVRTFDVVVAGDVDVWHGEEVVYSIVVLNMV